MKRVLLAFFVVLSAAAHGTDGCNLDCAFKAAMTRSETLADQTELVNQAEMHYRQATGSIIPSITGSASFVKQENAGGGAIFPTDQPNAKIGLSAPLFRGFREFAALRQTKALTAAQTEAKRQATRLLFNDVATNFFNVMTLEQDLKNYNEQFGAFEQRIKELRGRIRIGRSRITEELTVQSSLSTLRSSVAAIKGQIATAREMFSFYTGLSSETTLVDDQKLPETMEPVEQYLATLKSRPDVRAAEARLTAAQENVGVQRGAHLPSIDGTANYYLVRPAGILQNVHWDVGVALTIPIFAGGVISSKVEEAESQRMQGELAVSLATRQATQEIRSLYKSYHADVEQLAQLEEAKEITEKNFKEETKEYRLGLVTNLDVLQALTSFEDAVRACDRARFVGKLDYLKLQTAADRVAAIK